MGEGGWEERMGVGGSVGSKEDEGGRGGMKANSQWQGLFVCFVCLVVGIAVEGKGGFETKRVETVRNLLATGMAPPTGPWLQVSAGKTKNPSCCDY